MKRTHVYAYYRKSQESEERQALSIPSQKEELAKVAKNRGLKISKTFQEAKSAKNPGRPVFNQMLKELEKSGINNILVWHPDRLSRNSVDSGQLIYLMDQNILNKIITPSQTFYNTPNDKFLFNLLCGQAKLENDNRGINAKRGMKTKAEMGWYPATAPIGYKNTSHKKKGYKIIVNDEDTRPIVKKCFQEILKGRQAIEVYREMTEEYPLINPRTGTTISRSSFYNMLNHPFYYGEFEWPKDSENWYKGAHEPIISEEEFDVIQKMLGNNGKPIQRSHVFELTGLFRCDECGAAITATKKVKHYPNTGNTVTYIYYHCGGIEGKECSQKPITEDEMIEKLADKMLKICPSQGFIDWARKWLSYLHKQQSTDQTQVMEAKHTELERAEKRLDRLLDVYLNESIDEDKYQSKKRELEKQKKKLEKQVENVSDDKNDWRRKIENSLDFAQAAHDAFINGSRDERRFILMEISSNLTYKTKKPLIQPKEIYSIYENEENWDKKYADKIELAKYTELWAKKPDLEPTNPAWLPG